MDRGGPYPSGDAPPLPRGSRTIPAPYARSGIGRPSGPRRCMDRGHGAEHGRRRAGHGIRLPGLARPTSPRRSRRERRERTRSGARGVGPPRPGRVRPSGPPLGTVRGSARVGGSFVSAVVLLPGPVSGRIQAPPSKSYTHRALVVGHLSGRPYRIERPLDADDTRATAFAIGQLGTPVDFRPGGWLVTPGPAPTSSVTIDAGESGTTLRFLSAAAARGTGRVRFTGHARLGARPMRDLLSALTSLGAAVRAAREGLPIEVRGPLRGGDVRLDASKSSQFASSLLLTLPTLASDSELELMGEVVSAPYIDATLAVLRHHQVSVVRRGRKYSVPGGQRYRGVRFRVPGDASSAAYLWAAAALGQGPVRVEGLAETWPQADRRILPILRTFGAHLAIGPDWVSVSEGGRRPFSVDLT